MKNGNSYETMIKKLAFEAPITIYRLNKETGYSTSTIHASIQRLTREKFVKRSKGGYVFSFIGLIRYFMQRFGDRDFGREYVKKIVQKYAPIMDYALFTEHEWIEENIGGDYYDMLLSSAFATYQDLTSRIHVVLAKAVTPVKRGEKVVVTGIELPSLEELEKEWMRTYTIWFFDLLTREPHREIKPLANPKLRSLVKETYEKEISLREESISRLTMVKGLLLGSIS